MKPPRTLILPICSSSSSSASANQQVRLRLKVGINTAAGPPLPITKSHCCSFALFFDALTSPRAAVQLKNIFSCYISKKVTHYYSNTLLLPSSPPLTMKLTCAAGRVLQAASLPVGGQRFALGRRCRGGPRGHVGGHVPRLSSNVSVGGTE